MNVGDRVGGLDAVGATVVVASHDVSFSENCAVPLWNAKEV